MFSYPLRSCGQGWKIVEGLAVDDFSRQRIAATEAELKEEKSLVADLLPR